MRPIYFWWILAHLRNCLDREDDAYDFFQVSILDSTENVSAFREPVGCPASEDELVPLAQL